MAVLPVSVQVVSVSINSISNTYTIEVALAPGDSSGFSNFSMSWSASGIAPRYAIGATTTLNLP